METKTLKGIFPSPKKTPKRDFLKENILQVKNLKKTSRESIPTGTAAFKRSVQTTRRDRDIIRHDRESHPKSRCSTSASNTNSNHIDQNDHQEIYFDDKEDTKSQRSQKSDYSNARNIASATSICSSLTCDQSSQTGDVNDELFLKNTIIRYPSDFETKLLEQDKFASLEKQQIDRKESVEVIGDHIENMHRKKKPFFGGRFQEVPDEFTHRMDRHVSDLSEYLTNGVISRNKITKQKRELILQKMAQDNQSKHKRLNSRQTTHFNEQYDEQSENNDDYEDDVTITNEFALNNNEDDNGSKSSDLEYYEKNSDCRSDTKTLVAMSKHNSQKSLASSKNSGSYVKKVNFKNDPNAPPPNYKIGEIPKYLSERKEEIKKQNEIIRNDDPHCPEGHFVLSDEDRLKSLGMAENKYKLLVNELNRMPLTSQTMKIRGRKMEIERELDKLEETIRIFKRTRVYVKIDE